MSQISNSNSIAGQPGAAISTGSQDNSPLEVTILMPCLNEDETIVYCVEEALLALQACNVSGEVLVADNGSTDDSRELATRAGARIVEVKEKGYGSALIAGIKSARGEYVLMGDADGSYDFGELPNFLEHLKQGKKLVMGCRLPAGGGSIEKGAMPWLHRWIGNPVLSTLGKVFFKSNIDDFHCGLRAFHRQSILGLDLQCTGMELASEMPVKASLASLPVQQIPVTLRPDRRSGAPHLRSWRDGWRHLRFMLLFSPRWLFLIPGITLFTIGLSGFIALLFGPLNVGNVTFDTNTLLVCAAMILVGFQALFFAVFTKAFAVRFGVLPPDNRITAILDSHTVEIGIVGGILLAMLGAGYLVAAVLYWQNVSFGDLPYAESLRIVIPAVTAIALGIQSIFGGFLLAILNLPRRNNRSSS
jgi:glycosyltransferase involved in cell wall biosynthesis